MGTITEERHIDAPPEAVYAVVSDPAAVAQLSPECVRTRWLDGGDGPRPGRRFRGYNRNGVFRWSTTARIIAADPSERFAYEVSYLGLTVSEWRYELEPRDGGTLVRESTTDRRPRWFAVLSTAGTGVRDRTARNREGMRATLAGLDRLVTGGR